MAKFELSSVVSTTGANRTSVSALLRRGDGKFLGQNSRNCGPGCRRCRRHYSRVWLYKIRLVQKIVLPPCSTLCGKKSRGFRANQGSMLQRVEQEISQTYFNPLAAASISSALARMRMSSVKLVQRTVSVEATRDSTDPIPCAAGSRAAKRSVLNFFLPHLRRSPF